MILLVVAATIFVGCGDKVCNVPDADRVNLHVRLGCSQGLTLYSITGSCYIEGAVKEKDVDAMNGRGVTFTVAPNTKYIVRANNVNRDGELFGSIEVMTPGPGQDTAITIPCN